MPLIRSLTIHLEVSKWSRLLIVENAIKVLENVEECCRKYGVDPWTIRILFPVMPQNVDFQLCKELVLELDKVLPRHVLIQVLSLEATHPCVNSLPYLISLSNRVYGSIRCSDDICIEKVIKLWKGDTKDLGYEVFSRIALVIGTWIESPYFPASANISGTIGMSISHRYVDLVREALAYGKVNELLKYLKEMESKIISIALCARIPYLGTDLSLSPWNEESVARLVEELIGNKFGMPGTTNALYALNLLVRSLARKADLKVIGFNEVMLPVAEDNILNERVKEGIIRLRDLIHYSMLCVAGLDMVAIPKDVDLLRVAMDMYTIHRIKNKTLGFRIIPTDLEPGNRIEIPGFGHTYVVYL